MARKKKLSGRKIGKSRSVNDLRRVRGNRSPSKVLIIVCEGEKTEPLYFKAIRNELRLSSLNIHIIPNQGAPITIVDRAIKEKRCVSKGDEIWCVFDVEQLSHNPTFKPAVDKARRAKIGLAITNPAFEYWYLMHYECTDRPFTNANEVEAYLKKYLPSYDKSISIYNQIEDKTDLALENASKLRKNSDDNWEDFPNSSTGVDKLVLKILEIEN